LVHLFESAWFAVVPGLNEEVILTPSVIDLISQVSEFNVPASKEGVGDEHHDCEPDLFDVETCGNAACNKPGRYKHWCGI
jgi:hypothetical protein